MIIYLHPQRRSNPVELSASADVLVIDGQKFDFSPLPEGAVLPYSAVGSELLIDDVTRVDGELQVHILFPIGQYASEAARFPSPIKVTQAGAVALPDPGFEEAAHD